MADLFFSSVTDAAKQMISACLAKNLDEMERIRNYLNGPEHTHSMSGTADDFHNASVQLSRMGFYEQAYTLVAVGNKRYPKNTDLLGDLLVYGMR